MKSKGLKILKAHGGVEEFSKRKLFNSLQHSGLSKRESEIITNKVAREITEGFKTRDIYHKTLQLVKETSPHAAIQYSLKRSLFDLGPTGHHFETYVARYFETKGFVTTTCKILSGKLVKHEVDVIAQKNGKRSFIECKFHNRLGIKNDIKIALYVKARRDDLQEGPEGDNLEQFYLASNTAFTTDAITYAKGSNLILLGINAPTERSFFEEIRNLKLYPVTSLKSINKTMKKALLNRNIVLAKELKNNSTLLLKMGMKEFELKRLFAEIDLLHEDNT